MPALIALRSSFSKRREVGPALSRWLAESVEKLQALAGEKPKRPVDFRREGKLGCKCRDCEELAKFLRDPVEKVHRFPMGKPRRRHLHGVIQINACDVSHVTERRGSPQTLVCTKNDASHRRRLKQYQEDRKNLKTLRAMRKGGSKATPSGGAGSRSTCGR